MSDFANLSRRGFIETRKVLDPTKQLILTGPNGKMAWVLSSSFPQSKTLKDARFDAKLPARVTMLQEDFIALAIADRSTVQIQGYKLTVIVIEPDPVDPLTDLTLTSFA